MGALAETLVATARSLLLCVSDVSKLTLQLAMSPGLTFRRVTTAVPLLSSGTDEGLEPFFSPRHI